MRVLKLKAKTGDTLDAIVDHIRAEMRNLPRKVESFELVEGAAPLFGAGDAPTVEIIVRYTVDDPETLNDIDRLIELAGERADEIEVIIDDE